MKKVIFLLILFAVLCSSAFAYYLNVRAFLYPFEYNQVEINARIYIDGVYTGYLTPHQFEPYVGGVYTVEHDDYDEWVPESALVEEIPASGTVIFGTYPDETLPVELSYFTATTTVNNLVNIQWVTQSETALRGFYILRGEDDQLSTAQAICNLIPATNTSTQQTYIYHDTELFDDGVYYYWLQSVDNDGTTYYNGPSFIYYNPYSGEAPEIPLNTELMPVYPNPFNPSAFIPYNVATRSDVKIRITNMRGQTVKQIDLGTKDPGNYQIVWNGDDSDGNMLANGVYSITMIAGKNIYYKKAVLLK